MPIGMVSHYKPCPLVRCHCNWYFTCSVQMEEGWLQVWCYLYISADPIPRSQVCLLVQCISIIHACWVHLLRYVCFVKCFSIRQDMGSVTNRSDMPTGKVPVPRVYKTFRIIVTNLNAILNISNSEWCMNASLGCYKDDVCNSRFRKLAFCMQIPGVCQSQWRFSYSFCNKLQSWRQYWHHSFYIFYLVTS